VKKHVPVAALSTLKIGRSYDGLLTQMASAGQRKVQIVICVMFAIGGWGCIGRHKRYFQSFLGNAAPYTSLQRCTVCNWWRVEGRSSKLDEPASVQEGDANLAYSLCDEFERKIENVKNYWVVMLGGRLDAPILMLLRVVVVFEKRNSRLSL
jgi:hypothetical protein